MCKHKGTEDRTPSSRGQVANGLNHELANWIPHQSLIHGRAHEMATAPCFWWAWSRNSLKQRGFGESNYTLRVGEVVGSEKSSKGLPDDILTTKGYMVC